MQRIGAYEAKTRLAELLDRVEQGERFVLTRHGVPVAMLVPVGPRQPVSEVIGELRRFRQGRRLGGISVRELIEEGRRF